MSAVQLPAVSRNQDWKISLEANDLLECFVSGLDKVILQIAIAKAAKRCSASSIRVEPEDVREAADHVFGKILANSDLPKDLLEQLRSTEACLKEKCSRAAR